MILSTFAAIAALSSAQDPGEAIAALISRSDGIARSSEIGRSAGDRPVHVVTIARPGGVAIDQRPAVLIVAGAHGGHRLGTELALWQADRLVADAQNDPDTGALLEKCVVYVVPLVNPDGPALGRTGNAKSIDADRDGRRDEDGHDDLDGNGVITQMRWKDPDGEWIVDPDEPRVMRKADPDQGERGVYSIGIEARDSDADDARGEDVGQGIQIWRNFSHRFDEFDRTTGPFPMSEPSTRALADFVYAHKHIAIAFAYDADDNLVAKVPTDKPKARTQLNGILEVDSKLFETAGKLYRELTGRSGKVRARMDGSLWSWLHFQVGVPTMATDVWRVPEPTGKDKLSAERVRLAHCDKVRAGFVPWRRHSHPELGEVEIGGFVQGDDYKLMPVGDRDNLFAAHQKFTLQMLKKLPHAHIASFTKKALPGGAFELEAAVENDGEWPILTGNATRSNRFAVPRIQLHLGDAALLVGRPRDRTRNLEGVGGRQKFKWIVTGSPGTKVRLELTLHPVGGDQKEVTL